jgi:hypothetical protein
MKDIAAPHIGQCIWLAKMQLTNSHQSATVMTPVLIRHLVIHTICNVTGKDPADIVALDRVELNTRDWEQVFSRLEASLDIDTGMLSSRERAICVDALAQALHAKLAGDVID